MVRCQVTANQNFLSDFPFVGIIFKAKASKPAIRDSLVSYVALLIIGRVIANIAVATIMAIAPHMAARLAS